MQAITLISNSHLFFNFFTWKIKIINFYYSNYWGPEVVRSSCYRKNIGAEFTHLYIPSLCEETFMIRHIRGHSNNSMIRNIICLVHTWHLKQMYVYWLFKMFFFWKFVISCLLVSCYGQSIPCQPKEFGYSSFVCVCNG